jgi:TetR/AcrR family transcriptional regulator, ethionamide resistance regulator
MPASRPVGRRGVRKGDRREAAILDTAERLLAEKSFASIGIEELAVGAAISRPTFYFYFASKHAVLAALVDRISDDLYLAADNWRLPKTESPGEWIKSNIEIAAHAWREHGPVLRAAAETWGLTPEKMDFWGSRIAELIEASTMGIAHLHRRGISPSGGPSPRALATALIWMGERCLYIQSRGADPSLDQAEVVDALATIGMRALFLEDDPAPDW